MPEPSPREERPVGMAARRKASSFASASSPSGGRDDLERPDATRIEAIGALSIALLGVPLHFLYSSTHWAAIGWLGPVNESVWEHFKLAFWPGVLFALLARRLYAQKPPNYWSARLLSLSATPALIALIFYASRALAPGAGLAVDILNFFFSVAVAQWLGWRALRTRRPWGTEAAALATIALLCAAFAVFSYRPPAIELFRAPGWAQFSNSLGERVAPTGAPVVPDPRADPERKAKSNNTKKENVETASPAHVSTDSKLESRQNQPNNRKEQGWVT